MCCSPIYHSKLGTVLTATPGSGQKVKKGLETKYCPLPFVDSNLTILNADISTVRSTMDMYCIPVWSIQIFVALLSLLLGNH